MTLLITVFAAIAATVVWYKSASRSEMKIGILCWIFWGASIMWLVDAVFEYAEVGADFFSPSISDAMNDAFLGFSAVALGLIIWIVILFIKDPKGVIKEKLLKKKD